MVHTEPEGAKVVGVRAAAEKLPDPSMRLCPEKAKASMFSLELLQTAAIQTAAPIVVAFVECDDKLRTGAFELFKQMNSGELDAEAFHATTALLAEILFPDDDQRGAPGLDVVEAEEIARSRDPEAKDIPARMDEEEAVFARRLGELMQAKGLTQAELAARVGLGQPAVSMMLNRTCRPQRKTVLRFAQALEVAPEELWPQLKPE